MRLLFHLDLAQILDFSNADKREHRMLTALLSVLNSVLSYQARPEKIVSPQTRTVKFLLLQLLVTGNVLFLTLIFVENIKLFVLRAFRALHVAS